MVVHWITILCRMILENCSRCLTTVIIAINSDDLVLARNKVIITDSILEFLVCHRCLHCTCESWLLPCQQVLLLLLMVFQLAIRFPGLLISSIVTVALKILSILLYIGMILHLLLQSLFLFVIIALWDLFVFSRDAGHG